MNATSKLTAQAQVSVPASVRRKLGIGPGSVLEWEERDGQVVVRRAGVNSSAAIHAALFERKPVRKSLAEIRRGVAASVRKRHARD